MAGFITSLPPLLSQCLWILQNNFRVKCAARNWSYEWEFRIVNSNWQGGLKGTLLTIFLSDNPNWPLQGYLGTLAQTHCVLLPFQIQVLSLPPTVPVAILYPPWIPNRGRGEGREGGTALCSGQSTSIILDTCHGPKNECHCTQCKRERVWISWRDSLYQIIQLVWPFRFAKLYPSSNR